MKKRLLSFLSVILSFALLTASSFASSPPKISDMRGLIDYYKSLPLASPEREEVDALLSFYEDSEIFQQDLNMNPQAATDMAARQLAEASTKSISVFGEEGNYYYCPNVTAIDQTYNNWCGPASMYMSLHAIGRSSAISGSTWFNKLTTLAVTDCGLSSGNGAGAIVYQLRNGLNKYMTSSTKKYAYIELTSQTQMLTRIKNSLKNDKPVIVNVKTRTLPYMPNTSAWESGHYIVVEGIDENNLVAYVVDPNYVSQYRGKHTVSITQLYNSIKAGNGHIVYYLP